MRFEGAGTRSGLISVDRLAGLVQLAYFLTCLAFALVRYVIFANDMISPSNSCTCSNRDLSLMRDIQYSHLTLEKCSCI